MKISLCFLLVVFLTAPFAAAQDIHAIAHESSEKDRRADNESMQMPPKPGAAKTPANPKAKEDAYRKQILSSMSELEVTVDRVVSGDTFETVVDGTRMTMRLAGMDAPEQGQENWIAARNHLIHLISGQKVTVKFSSFYPKHPNGFFIVRAFVDGADVGDKMLNDGWVWYDQTYGVFFDEKQHENNIKAMKAAKAAKLGIWQSGNATEPWEYFEKMEKEKTGPAKKN